MDKVAVVILTWNGIDFLKKFLPSVIENSPEAKIYVADNGSTDDTVNFLKNNFPTVLIIENGFNAGFTEGYNLALSKIQAEYYVLLNSDVEVTKDWLIPLIDLLDRDKYIAACQPKILSYHEPHKFEYAGAAGGYLDYLGYPFCRGRMFHVLEEDQGQYNDVTEIFWATGACMFIRASAFHEAHGFDKEFFAHMEEIDLCWRLKNLGYKIMYCGHSTVYHVGGGTLSKANPRKTYLNFRNSLSLLIKNLPGNWLFPRVFTRLVLDGVAGVKFLFSDSFSHCWAVVKSHYYVYWRIRRIWNKRKVNLSLARTLNHKEMYPNSIVWDFYIKKMNKFSMLNWKR